MEFLRKSMLFRGMDDEEISDAFKAFQAKEESFSKDEIILPAGSATERMGIILEGSVTIETCDLLGNRTIFSHVGAGGFFAETYALLSSEPMLVDVAANEKCRILFLTVGGAAALNSHKEAWASKFIANLLIITAHKNLALSGRNLHIAPKTIREKLMSYLTSVAIREHSHEFAIPFDRQQLADYLNVDRSALSKELGKMRQEGIISSTKNHFAIHSSSNMPKV